jgi:hypothetical protein
MSEYRKKPVAIEAFQFQRRNNGPVPYPDWYDDAVTRNDIITHNTGKWHDPTQPAYCEIKTLEGVMRANEGDWIIRGIKGEIYPCRDDIFAATYEIAAPVSAPLDTQALPPPSISTGNCFPNFADAADQPYYSADQVRNIIAPYAERIRHLERELEQFRPSDGFMLVRKPEWAKEKEGDGGEYVCCGGYTPCRGQCAVYQSGGKEKA